MKFRTLALLIALPFAAWAQQSMTIVELSKFIYSSTHNANVHLSDKEVADYLGKVRLKEKLDESTLEKIQAENPDLGARTFGALKALKDKSANLPAPKPGETAMVYSAKAAAPSNEEQGRLIDAIRDYALNYSDQLPDFICTEVTTQYAGPRSGGLSKVGELQSHLTYFQKKETYKPYLNNGRLTDMSYEKIPGARLVGDFGTMLRGIFEPASQDQFDWLAGIASTIRRSWSSPFKIARENSNWELNSDGAKSIVTAYHGTISVDPKSKVVLQVETIADNIPPDFPIRAAQDVLTYAPRDISGHQFLLPQAVQISMEGADGQSRLESVLRITASTRPTP